MPPPLTRDPERHDEAMMGELERILIELEADTAVRAVVLTGAGRAFSSGGDQKRARSGEGQQPFVDGDLGGVLIGRLNRCVLHLQPLQKPIVGRRGIRRHHDRCAECGKL